MTSSDKAVCKKHKVRQPHASNLGQFCPRVFATRGQATLSWHSRAHPSRVSREDTRAMPLARAFCATPTRVVPPRVVPPRLSASPARGARLVARTEDGPETSSSISTSSGGFPEDGTASTPSTRPELLFEPPPVPRPATPAPPADLAQVADALEPPLEPLVVAPEPHPPTRAEEAVAADALPDADARAEDVAEDAFPEPPEAPASEAPATRGARPILGRLALCRNDPSLAPYEGALKARYDLHASRRPPTPELKSCISTLANDRDRIFNCSSFHDRINADRGDKASSTHVSQFIK